MPIETQSSSKLPTKASPSSIHPQGWVPIETTEVFIPRRASGSSIHPQGWVPIETEILGEGYNWISRSIHPQGWVPIETRRDPLARDCFRSRVAFTPKGGCPLKLAKNSPNANSSPAVAFTPKGGCPLKHANRWNNHELERIPGSIHPQGWVPIETLKNSL